MSPIFTARVSLWGIYGFTQKPNKSNVLELKVALLSWEIRKLGLQKQPELEGLQS